MKRSSSYSEDYRELLVAGKQCGKSNELALELLAEIVVGIDGGQPL